MNYERIRYVFTECLFICSSGGRASLAFQLHLRKYWCSPRRMTSENLRGMWLRQKLFSKLPFVDVRIGIALWSVIVVTGPTEIIATAVAEFRIARLSVISETRRRRALLSSHDRRLSPPNDLTTRYDRTRAPRP